MTAIDAAPARDRIAAVDALRGFALFGILMANILVLSGWEFLSEAGRTALAGERGASMQRAFHHGLIDGKFYTIFSLLFGAGFALQLSRLNARGADGARIYRRRVLILFAIGIVHSFLIWDGDILTLYALMGLILPLFIRLSDRWLLLSGAALIFIVPPLGIWLFRALGWAPDLGLMALSERLAVGLGAVNPEDGVTWLRREDFAGWFSFVATGPIYAWGLKIMSWRVPKVLGVMVIGIWLGRRLASGQILDDRRLLWRIALGGLAIGVPANIAYALRGDVWQTDWSSLIGTVPLGFAYAALFALAWPHAHRALRLFAAPGRMALTNYLLQSSICILIFYGFGFGFGQIGRWPPPAFYAFALGLYALQVAFSRWWLAHHAQGPMEALWRRLTYAGSLVLTPRAASV